MPGLIMLLDSAEMTPFAGCAYTDDSAPGIGYSGCPSDFVVNSVLFLI